MKSLFRHASALALLSSANATVLLNDTFADLSRTNASLPGSADWVVVGSNVASSTAASGALVTTASSGFSLSAAFANDSGVTLANGETMRLSFSVTIAFNGTNDADSFRFGIFDSNGSQITADNTGSNGSNAAFNAWDGYSYWSPNGSPALASTAAIRERSGTNNILYNSTANGTVLNTVDYTNGSLANGTYTGLFSITRNGTDLSFTASLGGTSLTATDATPDTYTFDSISFFAGSTPLGTNGSFTLDNVMVEVIPEPSSLLVAAIAPFAFLRRRR